MTRFSGWLKELQNFVDGDECGDVMMCDTRGVFQNEKKTDEFKIQVCILNTKILSYDV